MFLFSCMTMRLAKSYGLTPHRSALGVRMTSNGRGVFASRGILPGELLYRAEPMLTHPSVDLQGQVCQWCLRWLSPASPGPHEALNGSNDAVSTVDSYRSPPVAQGPTVIPRVGETLPRVLSAPQGFCSTTCESRGLATFLGVQRELDLGPLHNLCKEAGAMAPLLAVRAAMTAIAARSGRVVNEGEGPWSRQGVLASLGLLDHLCSIDPSPSRGCESAAWPPALWREVHGEFLRSVRVAFGTASAETASAEHWASLESFARSVSRFQLNQFRVQVPRPIPPCMPPARSPSGSASGTDSLSETGEGGGGRGGFGAAMLAAAVESLCGDDSHGKTGCAVYLVPSMFNHSCEPSVDVVFPEGSAAMELRARRCVSLCRRSDWGGGWEGTRGGEAREWGTQGGRQLLGSDCLVAVVSNRESCMCPRYHSITSDCCFRTDALRCFAGKCIKGRSSR